MVDVRASRLAIPLICLLVLAGHHLGKGFYYLAVQNSTDALAGFNARRLEGAYLLDRVSPLSQYFEYVRQTDPTVDRFVLHADPRSTHGPLWFGGMPPWCYPLQLVVYLPVSERLARIYLAVLDASALAVLGWFAASAVASSGRRIAIPLLAVLSVLAIGAVNSTLTQGQSGLVVDGCLVAGCLVLRARPRSASSVAAGALLAVAMIKPSISVLFLLPLLLARRVAVMAWCVAIVGAAWLASSWWIRISPSMQLAQFDRASLLVISTGANVLLQTAVNWLHSARAARDLFGAAGLLAALAGTWRLRTDPVAMFGVLAVVARLFTYHSQYDDVMLAFLMIALTARAWSQNGTLGWRLAWLTCGLSLWLPYSVYVPPGIQVLQVGCWIGLATALCVWVQPDRHAIAAPPRRVPCPP